MSCTVSSVMTGSFTMDYFTFGSGTRPLVILPGINMLSMMPQAEKVAAAFAAFGERYTVYLFDRRRDVPDGYSVEDMADDTAAAFSALGIKDADLYGVSQGGMMSFVIAAKYPHLVHKMALASTVMQVDEEGKAVFDRWCDLAEEGEAVALNRAVFEKVYSPAYRDRYRDVFASLEREGTADDIRRFFILSDACRRFDGREAARQVSCTTMFIGSRNDAIFSETSMRQFAECLAADCYMYDGYSHAVYDEAPDFIGRLFDYFTEE